MGLIRNGTLAGHPFHARGSGIAAYATPMHNSIAFARAFGRGQSVPQGYNSERALRMPVTSQGYIAARARSSVAMQADLKADGNMAAAIEAEADMIAAANVLFNASATFAADADMIVNLLATGNISASMDILARPSANDISQEVWAFILSGDTAGNQLIKALRAAKLAAALSA